MKKVLIITYYWPPAGGPGVLRWLKFSRYLPEFGIEPIIYTPKNPTYPIVDHSLEQEIPENIKIIKKKIREPYVWASLFSKKETGQISSGNITSKQNQSFLQKLLLYIRGNFFIPDARILWRNPSVDRKSTRLNSSHVAISYAVFCLKKKTKDIKAAKASLLTANIESKEDDALQQATHRLLVTEAE